MSMSPFNGFQEPRVLRCRKCREALAVRKGLCGPCSRAERSTSDGVHTGRVPKLTAEQVAAIKRMNAALVPKIRIAKRFGVSRDTIGRVLSGNYQPAPE